MTIENFTPIVWSARIRQAKDKALVYGRPEVINRNYQGEFAQGKRVNIQSVAQPTISDYTKNTNHADPEELSDEQRFMEITEAKMFNFQVDDIDAAQTFPKGGAFAEGMRKAAYGLADVSDQFVAAMYSDIAAGNQIGSDGSPISITSTNIYKQMTDMRTALSDNNVPRSEEAFLIVPPWFYGLLLNDDRFVKVGTPRSDGALVDGIILKGAGLTIYESNNVPNTGGSLYKIIAGIRGAWSYANQIQKVKAYEPEKRFGDAVKGLDVYGAKVIEPTQLVLLTANDGS